MFKKKLSLTARLTIGFTLSSVTLVLISTLYLYWSLVTALKYRDENFFSSRIEAIRSLLARDDGGKALRFRIEKEWPARTSEVFYIRLLDESDRVLAESPGENQILRMLPSPETVRLRSGKTISPRELIHLGSQAYRSFISTLDHGGANYFVQIALDRTQEDDLLTGYRNRIIAVLIACFVVCCLICVQISRRGLQPIREMEQKAARITSSNLDEKIQPGDMPLELAHLAKTFNEMLDRLRGSFERHQQFSADIAHELRTPINNISGEIQVTLGKGRSLEYYEEVLGSNLEECARISRIIDSLLFLAHAENPRISLSKEPINLQKELQAVLEFYEPAATENGVTCRLKVEGEILINVERTLFQRAVGNILSNAIKKTDASGKIEISASHTRDEVEIAVTDSGVGIPEEHLPHLFDRFYRVDASRSKDLGGSGLGLAIVKSIASIHGGDVEITSKVGIGTRVCLSLPMT